MAIKKSLPMTKEEKRNYWLPLLIGILAPIITATLLGFMRKPDSNQTSIERLEKDFCKPNQVKIEYLEKRMEVQEEWGRWTMQNIATKEDIKALREDIKEIATRK